MIRAVCASDPRAEPGLVFGLLAAGRGVGSVVAGPLSEALVSAGGGGGGGVEKMDGARGYGTGFSGLIVFTGVSVLLGGVGVFGRRVGWL